MRNASEIRFKKYLAGGSMAALLVMALGVPAHAEDSSIDSQVIATVRKCQKISASCAAETEHAMGVLVFPSVVKADLIVGGSGGRGALIENSRITGYYSLGSGSIGLQAGVNKASQVYVFRTAAALANLKKSPDWQAKASAGVTLVSAANSSNTSAVTGDVLAYVFNARGLEGGVALDTFDIWQTAQKRPQTPETQ